MSRTIIDIDDAALARAQRALRTTTKRDTVNAALELAAAVTRIGVAPCSSRSAISLTGSMLT